SNRRRSGAVNLAEDFNGAAMAAASSLNSAAPDSAISSKRFLAAGGVVRLSADLAGAKPRPNAEPTSKPIFWSRLKKRCTGRHARFRCVALAQTKSKIIR